MHVGYIISEFQCKFFNFYEILFAAYKMAEVSQLLGYQLYYYYLYKSQFFGNLGCLTMSIHLKMRNAHSM